MKATPRARKRQIFLKAQGFYKGPIDGKFGRNSKRAEDAYQRSLSGEPKPKRLSHKQARILHTYTKSLLTIWAKEQGLDLADKDCHSARSDHRHMSGSQHEKSLATDKDLYIDGVYQTTTRAHKAVGAKWESLSPHNRWGGRYNDGNHYETFRSVVRR